MSKIFKTLVCVGLIFAMLHICDSAKNDVEKQKKEFFENEEIWHDIDELDTLDISKTYAYEELVELYEKNGFTNDEITELIDINHIEPISSNTIVRYSLFKLDTFTYEFIYKLQPRITIGLEYADSSAASPTRIISLKGAHIYTGLGNKCNFNGNTIYELEAGNSFYYNFYGDIYKEGTVNRTIDESVSVTCKLSNGSGFIKNVSDSGRYYSTGLEP